MINNIRILAAAILASTTLAAPSQAFAAEPIYDTNWTFGVQLGMVKDKVHRQPSLQLSIGYDIDPIFRVEALANVNALFMRDGTDPSQPYEFNQFLGGRVLASVPLSESWKLTGGLGVGRLEEQRGLTTSGYTRTSTDEIVSAAQMYRVRRHWGIGVEASTFVQLHTVNFAVRSEVHF
jgi:hypothetical protein